MGARQRRWAWRGVVGTVLLAGVVAQAQPQAIPVWFSGFENGWPGGEWLNWSGNRPDQPGTSSWTILNAAQAAAEGVTPVEGTHVYKGWINSAASSSHRPYPGVSFDSIHGGGNPDFPNGVPSPFVNRFYVWMDWQPSQVSGFGWMSYLTLSNNVDWRVTTMSSITPADRLELAHVGPYGGFDAGNGWERLQNVYMPSRQWVRFTVYTDYRAGYDVQYVWMDGVPVFRANGGNIDQTTDYLLRAHWGLYASGNVPSGTMYNDSIQIWTLTEPWTEFAYEPPSPYEDNPRPAGDIDLDGDVDIHDMDLWIDGVDAGATGTPWDVNGDGTVDRADADAIAAILGLLPGDADRNGRVDDADLNLLLSRWGQAGDWGDGDFTPPGTVDDRDLSVLLSHWGDGNTAPQVPEPTTAVLLALGAWFLGRVK